MCLHTISYLCGKADRALLAFSPRSLRFDSCVRRRPGGALVPRHQSRVCCSPGSGWQNRAYRASARTLLCKRRRLWLDKAFAVHINRDGCAHALARVARTSWASAADISSALLPQDSSQLLLHPFCAASREGAFHLTCDWRREPLLEEFQYGLRRRMSFVVIKTYTRLELFDQFVHWTGLL
jgi:hypothetical protein